MPPKPQDRPLTLEEVRERYPLLLAPGASAEQVRRSLTALRTNALFWRKRGVPDDQNPAVTLLKELDRFGPRWTVPRIDAIGLPAHELTSFKSGALSTIEGFLSATDRKLSAIDESMRSAQLEEPVQVMAVRVPSIRASLPISAVQEALGVSRREPFQLERVVRNPLA